jgi:hypothetical protein
LSRFYFAETCSQAIYQGNSLVESISSMFL